MLNKNRPRSIKRNLVNSISVLFGVLIFAIYLSVDLSMDSWGDSQFDRALINKTNYLKSLVTVNKSGDAVKFNDGMMKDAKGSDDVGYYQLWYQDKSFKRSESLTAFPDLELLKISLPLNTTQIVDMKLPNGETGRASLSYFLPDSELLHTQHAHPAYLTLYESNSSLEKMLMFLDVLLVVSFFFSIFLVRNVATRIVSNGLQPLQYLNEEIKKIEINQQEKIDSVKFIDSPVTGKTIEEIEPIRKEINNFIQANQLLLQTEQRLTGDIAHELKTPIAEIISLSEVYIRYPNDERIGQSYKQDMLKIATRMKTIVDNLLLLQRSSSNAMQLDYDVLDAEFMLEQVLQDLAFKVPTIQQRVDVALKTDNLYADAFSLNVIITNLIDNALFYSPESSTVTVSLIPATQSGRWLLQVTNDLIVPLSQQDIEHILDPMYQADSSRTSNERHGLGLSIVDNICRQNGYTLTFNTDIAQQVTFTVGPIASTNERLDDH
ncbi:sensor histidine kinase [Vibrio algicola]|uniref:histidine kinase n=1 Tax=Vibrio algicola TaxID=2662262 RepID=A0A5Q0THN0_9VIBR|nr:HAMP domain-containing sensor histidine kinase [Vibrio algicola]